MQHTRVEMREKKISTTFSTIFQSCHCRYHWIEWKWRKSERKGDLKRAKERRAWVREREKKNLSINMCDTRIWADANRLWVLIQWKCFDSTFIFWLIVYSPSFRFVSSLKLIRCCEIANEHLIHNELTFSAPLIKFHIFFSVKRLVFRV